MLKYAVVKIFPVKDQWGGDTLEVYDLHAGMTDIKEAEKRRSEYLKHSTFGIAPQNCQVIQYKV